MRRVALLILGISTIYSCKKDSGSQNTTPPIKISGLPKDYTQYFAQNHSINYRTFKYDSNNNLAGVSMRENDTVGGVSQVDSGSYFFTVDPVADLPTGYTIIYRKSNYNKPQVETHALYFNSQKQVIKDSGVSVISGDNPNAPTRYYVYSGNTFARNDYAHGPAGWASFEIDSLITTNGNLAYEAVYVLGNSGNNWVLSSSTTINDYSSYPNPFYDPGLSYSFGAFLVLEGIEDFLSKNLFNDGGFTWKTDAQGRVVSGSAADGSYIKITYQ